MKRRAGQVGERAGRELLVPAVAALGSQAPRLHLIGHSFGGKLVTSAVLGGLRPESLVLLQAAFSAYAFAEAVPSTKRPGYYRRVVEDRLVVDRIIALRSDHDRALTRLYPSVTWGDQVDRAPRHAGRLARVREVVAASAMGAVGALGVGAVEVDLVAAQTSGLPHGIVTVDGSRVVAKDEWLVGAHRDIYHDEIATLVLLAAGLLTGGPDGLRSPRLSPSSISR
jgi:pimeloyl-ACP methyl ester carboxylesterase